MGIWKESECNKKWCPEGRPAVQTGIEDSESAPNSFCIGSSCAAWRWWDRFNPDYPDSCQRRHHSGGEGMRPLAERRGYCGKAGPVENP